MSKKTLLAAALCSAFASGAFASEVQIYGVLDYGMSYKSTEQVNGTKASSFSMESGQYIGSRFGLKGAEDLGNGTKVGFVLESSISADTGALGQNGRLFGREARVYVEGDLGMLTFGRMGPIVGGNGPLARFGHVVTPFSCGWGTVGGTLQVVSLGYEFVDNVVAYSTPQMGGFDATVMYSFGSDALNYAENATEGTSSVERMASAVVRYQDSTKLLSFGIETINHSSLEDSVRTFQKERKDAISYNLGGHYDAGWAKFYGYGQYFKNYQKTSKVTMFGDVNVNASNNAAIGKLAGGVDGYGAIAGVAVPAFGGSALFSFGYGDFDASLDSSIGMKTYQTAVGYNYWITRRTAFYAAADWIKNDYSQKYEAGRPTAVENVYEVVFGVMHKF